jgi:hypothetical protein
MMFLGSRERPVPNADNLTTIFQPIVWAMWDPQQASTVPVTGIPFFFTKQSKIIIFYVSVFTFPQSREESRLL